MEQDFAGRHVVVTGGTGSLGSAVVEVLESRGAICHVPTRGAAKSPRLVGSVNLADEDSVARFYRELPALWASIHCAGAFAFGPLADTSLDDFNRMVAANLASCFSCCRAAVLRLRRVDGTPGREGRGRIVNVAARPGVEPRTGAKMTAYAASKAAVAALTVALAEELATEGIWVNAIAPSILDTPANRSAMPNVNPASWVLPSEAAEVIAFLASPRNACARGSIVPVYGRG